MRIACFLLLLAAGLHGADYDLLIRNARVVDGTGNPWFAADVAVTGGRIAAIGALPEATADRVIDAASRVLAPGFIDVHSHIEKRVYRPWLVDFPAPAPHLTHT